MLRQNNFFYLFNLKQNSYRLFQFLSTKQPDLFSACGFLIFKIHLSIETRFYYKETQWNKLLYSTFKNSKLIWGEKHFKCSVVLVQLINVADLVVNSLCL